MTSAIWIYWFDVVVHTLFCRLEQVHLNRRDGIAKVLGTLTSFIGASVITLYKGPIIYSPNPPSDQSDLMFALGDAKEKNWTLGCICCFGHCLCWASWIVLQAVVLKKYPARFSVYSFTCFFSILQFLAIAGYFERDSCWGFLHPHARTGGVLIITQGRVKHTEIIFYVVRQIRLHPRESLYYWDI
jgi:drug/metabolite transporter (DMT)-like permease